MFTAWSIIASFEYFEDVDCPENVFVRSINWNLISFVVFLNRCLSLYRLCVTLIYYTWSRKYHPVRTISFIGKKHYNKMTYLLLISAHPSIGFKNTEVIIFNPKFSMCIWTPRSNVDIPWQAWMHEQRFNDNCSDI